MKKFEYLKPAMRYIQGKLDESEELYLMSDYYQEQFYVTEDSGKLVDLVDRDFYADPGYVDEHAKNYKLWKFVLGVEKTLYPHTYRRFKGTYLSGNHIRGESAIVGEVQALFSVQH